MANLSDIHSSLLSLVRLGLGKDASCPPVQDWRPIIEAAEPQGMSAVAFDGYAKALASGQVSVEMPKAVNKKWAASVLNLEESFITREGIASGMALIFAAEGIRTYVLKGFVVSECYPAPHHRVSVDMDCFLVPASGDGSDVWEKGNMLMEKNGFGVSRGFYKNSTFMLPGLTVENHKFLTPFRGNKRLERLEMLLQRMLRSDSGSDKIAGAELYRPPVMVSALFLVEHAFSHFLHEGLTLRHILDWVMFSRRHAADLDWPQFNAFVDEFGFRRFYDAYVHVGEYVMGDRPYDSLTPPEQRMMDSVWEGLDLHETVKGVRGKLNLVGNTLRAGWKYRLFSPISMVRALWIQVKGVVFLRRPRMG